MTPDEILNAYLEDKMGDGDRRRETGVYHVSRMGRCLKQTYLTYTLSEEKLPSKKDSWGNFQLGNQLEWLYEQALKNKYGYGRIANPVKTEYRVNDEILLIGNTDPVLLGKNLTAKKVYEVKSTKSIESKRIYGASLPHEYQLNGYLQALKCPGTLVYIDKRDLSTEKFHYSFDVSMFNKGINRIKELHEYIKKGEAPPTEPFMPEFECDWCELREAGLCEGI